MAAEDEDKPSSVSINVESLADSLTKKLEKPGNVEEELRTIFRVPRSDTDEEENAAYEPKYVSIGPFHHGKKALQLMEPLKRAFVGDLFNRSDDSRLMSKCIQMVAEEETRARRHYYGKIHLKPHELVEMLVIDGCFIIEFLVRFCQLEVARRKTTGTTVPNDRHDADNSTPLLEEEDATTSTAASHNLQATRSLTEHDLFWLLRSDFLYRLENQIPFFILEALYSQLLSDGSIPEKIDGTEMRGLTDLALFYIHMGKVKSPPFQPIAKPVYHLLHLFHATCEPPHKKNETDKTNLCCGFLAAAVLVCLSPFLRCLNSKPQSGKPEEEKESQTGTEYEKPPDKKNDEPCCAILVCFRRLSIFSFLKCLQQSETKEEKKSQTGTQSDEREEEKESLQPGTAPENPAAEKENLQPGAASEMRLGRITKACRYVSQFLLLLLNLVLLVVATIILVLLVVAIFLFSLLLPVVYVVLIVALCRGKKTAAWPSDDDKSVASRMIPCATDLRNAGIKFKKKKDADNHLDVTFDKKRTLEIPVFSITEETACRLRNLIALEKYFPIVERYFTSYAALMMNLMETKGDVSILKSQGILKSKLGSNKQVPRFFVKLCKAGHFSYRNQCYEGLFDDLKEYHESKWTKWSFHRWMAYLIPDYFTNPWAIPSMIAGSLLLVVTVLQTVYTILSYY